MAHVKEGQGSIDLKKESDDEDGGEDGDDEDKEESKIDIDNLVVTEEYPEDYEYKDNKNIVTIKKKMA